MELIALFQTTGGLVLGLISGLIQIEVMAKRKRVTPPPGPAEGAS